MTDCEPPRRTLILGGVRSGKSRMAEQLAADSGLPVTYIATARAWDDEMTQRIAAHRDRRPAAWRVVEEPVHLGETLARVCAPKRCTLVECLTLWLTNLLTDAELSDKPGAVSGMLENEIDRLVETVASAPGRLILVGNETNMGVIPLGELSRRYCDLAGQLHRELAKRCDQALLLVAGLPLTLKGSSP